MLSRIRRRRRGLDPALLCAIFDLDADADEPTIIRAAAKAAARARGEGLLGRTDGTEPWSPFEQFFADVYLAAAVADRVDSDAEHAFYRDWYRDDPIAALRVLFNNPPGAD